MDNSKTATGAMRKLFKAQQWHKTGAVLPCFTVGRGGWHPNLAKALEKRGLARLIQQFTWDSQWSLTPAGVDFANRCNRETVEHVCRQYEQGKPCRDGRDHCFNCGRHIDGNGVCPKRCGEGDESNDEAANA